LNHLDQNSVEKSRRSENKLLIHHLA